MTLVLLNYPSHPRHPRLRILGDVIGHRLSHTLHGFLYLFHFRMHFLQDVMFGLGKVFDPFYYFMQFLQRSFLTR